MFFFYKISKQNKSKLIGSGNINIILEGKLKVRTILPDPLWVVVVSWSMQLSVIFKYVCFHWHCRGGLGADIWRDVELPPLHLWGRSTRDSPAKYQPPGIGTVAVGGEDRGGDALRLIEHSARNDRKCLINEKPFILHLNFFFSSQTHSSKGPHLYRYVSAFDSWQGKLTCLKWFVMLYKSV